jgi:peptidoglycan/LPS O-acetylase OafA/YrhL
MGLVAGLASAFVGLLMAAIVVALVTGAATGTSGDQTFTGVLTAIFLGFGALMIFLDCRAHRGLRPGFWPIFAGTLVGVLGVVGGAVVLAILDVDVERSSGKLAALVGFGAGLLPGLGVHHLLTRRR